MKSAIPARQRSQVIARLIETVAAVCDQIRTVDKSRLQKPVGSLSANELTELEDGLRQILSL